MYCWYHPGTCFPIVQIKTHKIYGYEIKYQNIVVIGFVVNAVFLKASISGHIGSQPYLVEMVHAVSKIF